MYYYSWYCILGANNSTCMHDIVHDSGNKKLTFLELHTLFQVCTCDCNRNNGVETILNLHHGFNFIEASED